VMWHGPLEWKEVAVVHLNVVVSVPGRRLLLRQSNAAVLQRSEYRRRNVLIITLHAHRETIHTRTVKLDYHHTTAVLRPFFREHPGEPVPEENFWTLWCKGRSTEADTPTIRLGATPSRLTTTHLHHPPYFSQAGCHSCHPTNSVKALKANYTRTVKLVC